MLRWIQIEETEANELQEREVIPNETGYKYKDQLTGREMVEYHVDDCDLFQERMARESIFGGRRSVRFTEEEPCTIIVGHDEMVIKQFLLTGKGWFGPNGELPLLPKDEGEGVMISGFVSHELGFGLTISKEQFQQINRNREGAKYLDEAAALKVKGSALKQPLKSDPSIREFFREQMHKAGGLTTTSFFRWKMSETC
jgi:hypothetical protein